MPNKGVLTQVQLDLRAGPPPEGELRLAERDAELYGTGFLVNGLRVDPRSVRVVRREADGELADLDASALGPFVRTSETSRKAAVASYPRQGSQRHRIIARLFERQTGGRPGATRDELAAELGLSPNTVRPRVVELIAGGWVQRASESSMDTDETRRTALGREADVLVLTHAAMARCVRDGATSADRR